MADKIKELTSKIRQEVGEEMASKIASQLNSIEIAYADLSNNRKSIDEARVKYRDRSEELEKEVESLQGKVAAMSNDDSVKKLEQENNELKTFRDKVYSQNRETFKTKFSIIKEHPKFEKVKSVFDVPVNGDDFDFDALKDEQISQYLGKINEYEAIGIFETSKPNETPLKPKTGSGSIDGNKYTVNGREFTLSELANAYPEEYAKVRKERQSIQFEK